MLEVKSLNRRYGDIAAVKDVSFRIADRQVVGLLGHNGAGKTSIMRIIAGYLEPSSGEVLFNGCPMSADPKSLQCELGYLPEYLPL